MSIPGEREATAPRISPASGPPEGHFDWRTFDPATLPGGLESPLAAELVTFRDHLDEMLAMHSGEYVVIKGGRIIGYHPDRAAAVDAVFEAFGREPALVKQVLDYEPVRHLGGALS